MQKPAEQVVTAEVPTKLAFDQEQSRAWLLSQGLVSADTPFFIRKRSLDARGGTVKALLQVVIGELDDAPPNLYQDVSSKPSVIIVGAGPGGLFAALRLIELGLRPVVLERGKNVRDRRRDLAAINKAQIVNPESNYCFGEGGAGTYSDGKLYTRSNKRGSVRKVLHTFVRHGATSEILIDAHPHIGTNKLPTVVSAISQTIRDCGGEIRFDTRVTSLLIHNNQCKGVGLIDGSSIESEAVVLATGHSARDVFMLLHSQGIGIEAKAFAIGVRAEHSQAFVNQTQFKGLYPQILPPASYSLNHQARHEGRQIGVFSFCMCPGGFIVPAATEPGLVVVNGMSPSRRDSRFANSGIVVEVNQANWRSEHPLAGLEYQRQVERIAFDIGGGGQLAPAQTIKDFVSGRLSSNLFETSYQPGLTAARLDQALPSALAAPLRQAFTAFDKKMRGYSQGQAQIVGVESRTSSPVKIPRHPETLMHPDLRNLFPCGEGGGYAGGILSAAMDGERCAEAVAKLILKV